ncbi:MAG TPA: hypothetical protein VEP90_01730 [Methylomirabilota bacterium]|nr:hypothetical protein [Methylomirabilota bacterium]
MVDVIVDELTDRVMVTFKSTSPINFFDRPASKTFTKLMTEMNRGSVKIMFAVTYRGEQVIRANLISETIPTPQEGINREQYYEKQFCNILGPFFPVWEQIDRLLVDMRWED